MLSANMQISTNHSKKCFFFLNNTYLIVYYGRAFAVLDRQIINHLFYRKANKKVRHALTIHAI